MIEMAVSAILYSADAALCSAKKIRLAAPTRRANPAIIGYCLPCCKARLRASRTAWWAGAMPLW